MLNRWIALPSPRRLNAFRCAFGTKCWFLLSAIPQGLFWLPGATMFPDASASSADDFVHIARPVCWQQLASDIVRRRNKRSGAKRIAPLLTNVTRHRMAQCTSLIAPYDLQAKNQNAR